MSAPFQLTSSDPNVIDPVGLAADTHEWIEAVVPGGVHETLIAAGIIAHPYVEDHEKTVVGWRIAPGGIAERCRSRRETIRSY